MPDSVPRTDEPAARVIRVFVSSTFRDMVEEREQLAKHVFPALRKLCESRGVVWGGSRQDAAGVGSGEREMLADLGRAHSRGGERERDVGRPARRLGV